MECDFCGGKMPGDAWACPSCGAPIPRSARLADSSYQPTAADPHSTEDSRGSRREARRSGGILKTVVRVIGYIVVFFLLTWVLAWPVQGVLIVALGGEKTQQLYDTGWVVRLAAAIAIAVLVWRWFRRR